MKATRSDVHRLGVATYLVALVATIIVSAVWIGGAERATVLPDPEVPPLAESLVRDIPGFVVHYEGPNPNPVMTTDDIRLTESRRQALVDSHATAFVRPDFSAGVVVEVVLTRADGWGAPFLGLTGPTEGNAPGDFPELTDVAVIGQSDEWFEIESVTVDGVYGLRVQAFGTGPTAEQQARTVLQTATSDQHELLVQPAQLSTLDGINLERGRLALLSMEINGILIGALYLGVGTAVADRATRRRIGMRLRGHSKTEPPTGTVDVRSDARRSLRMSRWRGGATILAAVTLVVLASALRLSVPQSGILILLGLLGHGFVLRRLGVNPAPTGATHPRLRGWALAAALPLVAATLGLVLFGAGTIWIGLATDAIGVLNPEGLSLEAYQRLAVIVGCTALAASTVPLSIARRLGAAGHARRLQHDERTPTLFLRSFADDGVRLRSRSAGDVSPLDRLTLRRWERFEEIVARAVHSIGPIRALSDPGTRLPQLGAVRERVSDDAWQGRIAELIETSSLVVVSLARTEHCILEIKDLQQRGALHKTLFVVAPVDSEERRKRLDVLAHALDIAPAELDFESADTVVLAVVVHPLLGTRVFTSDAPDDVSYQLAIRAAQTFIETDWSQIPPALPTTNPAFTSVNWADEPRVWAPGHAPRKRVWYRRLPGVIALVILLSVAISALGEVVPPVSVGTPVAISEQIQRVVADPTSSDVIALGFDGQLFSVDPTTASVAELASLTGAMTALTTNGELVAGVHSQDQVLSAANLETGATWSVELESQPTELSITDHGIIVTFGMEGAVRRFDATDGQLLAEHAVDGIPWGVAPSNQPNSVFVTFADQDLIVEIDSTDLTTIEEHDGPPSPQSISRSTDGWSIETSYRAGVAIFDPDAGWEHAIGADRIYPARADGDAAQPSLETGVGQQHQLTAYLPGRREPCVLELASYSRAHVATPAGDIAVIFDGRPGFELFNSANCS